MDWGKVRRLGFWRSGRQGLFVASLQVLVATRFSFQHSGVMLKADGFFIFAAEPSVNGDRLFTGGDFHSVDKGFQPDRLVSIFTGHRIAVGLKLHEGRLAYFKWNYPAAFRREFGQGNEMALLGL